MVGFHPGSFCLWGGGGGGGKADVRGDGVARLLTKAMDFGLWGILI